MVHLITGGSGSGKSEYAEDMLCRYREDQKEQLIYVATMYPYGEETRRKISRHRQMRCGKGFETVECYTDLARAAEQLKKYDAVSVLIECISNLVSNELFPVGSAPDDSSGDLAAEALSGGILKKNTADEVLKGVEAVIRSARNVVIVTNEVNSEGLAYNPEMIRYKQVMGEVNCRLGKMADRVTEVVYGIAVEVKNGL